MKHIYIVNIFTHHNCDTISCIFETEESAREFIESCKKLDKSYNRANHTNYKYSYSIALLNIKPESGRALIVNL